MPTPADRLDRLSTLRDAQCLRGTEVGKVMHGMGCVFKSSAGSADSFSQSCQVSSIDDFISHNWSTSRLVKFLALAWHYNLVPAVVAAWALAGVAMGLTIAGVLPFSQSITAEQPRSRNAVWCGHTGFIIVFFFKYDLLRLLRLLVMCVGCRPAADRNVFLDKMCINQCNEKLKAEGIQHLAAFLRQSKRILVLYNSEFLRRMWTVYEIASFMTLHKDISKLLIVPVFWPQVTLCIYIGTIFVSVANHIINDRVGWNPFGLPETGIGGLVIVLPIAVPTMTINIRRWQKGLYKTTMEICSFDIRRASCSVEADRALLFDNIATFMRCLGKVQPSDSDDFALDVFTAMIQKEVPAALEKSIGHRTVPYKAIVAMTLASGLGAFDRVAEAVVFGRSWPSLVSELIMLIASPFVIAPIVAAALARLLRTRLHLSGRAEIAYLLLVTPCGCVPVIVTLWAPIISLRRLADADGQLAVPSVVVLLLYCIVLAVLTARLYRRGLNMGKTKQTDVCSPQEVDEESAGDKASARAEQDGHCSVQPLRASVVPFWARRGHVVMV